MECTIISSNSILHFVCVFKILTWPGWPRSAFLMTHVVWRLGIFNYRPAEVHCGLGNQLPPSPSAPLHLSPNIQHLEAENAHFLLLLLLHMLHILLLHILSQSALPHTQTRRSADETTYFLLMAMSRHQQSWWVYEWRGRGIRGLGTLQGKPVCWHDSYKNAHDVEFKKEKKKKALASLFSILYSTQGLDTTLFVSISHQAVQLGPIILFILTITSLTFGGLFWLLLLTEDVSFWFLFSSCSAELIIN